MLCTKIVLNVKTKQKQQFVYTTCSTGILKLSLHYEKNKHVKKGYFQDDRNTGRRNFTQRIFKIDSFESPLAW